MITYLTRWFRPLTLLELIARELDEAYRARLQAQTGVEYAHSLVEYNNAKIKRLEQLIAIYSKDKS